MVAGERGSDEGIHGGVLACGEVTNLRGERLGKFNVDFHGGGSVAANPDTFLFLPKISEHLFERTIV
jgi:hypothetical protein